MKTKKIVNICTKIVWALVILLLIGLGIARIVLYSQDAMNKKLEIFFDLISALGVIASIAFTGRSLSDNKDVQLATFIKDLNTNFNANDKNIQAYDLLCSCIHDKCQYCKNCKGKIKECCKRIPDEKEGESLLSNYFSFFGTVYAGCHYSLVNPELPKRRIESITNTLNAKFVITNSEYEIIAKEYFPNQEVININKLKTNSLNIMDDGIGKKLSGSVLGCLNDDGYFQGEDANLSFVHCYPASSMMTFAMVEILCHTYAQINSFSYRKSRGQRQTVRRLKNIVLTVPNGMSMTEKNVYLKRIQSAIDMYFFTTNKNTALKPKVHLDMDEASAIQLTYLYGEITNHFMGDTRAAISTLGRNRQLENGEYADVLRIASIDIGGGTSDLMISEYFNSAEHTIEQRSIFSEGFSVAGDEIAKRIIEKLILKRVFNWAKEKKEDINWDDFRNLFGPGHGGHDGDLNRFISMKAEMCRQIWIPMSMRYLEFAEMDSEDPNIELTFDRFFPDRMPGSNVLDFFSEQMRSLFGVDMTLSEIPWRISRAATNNVISNVLDNVLRIYSEVISLFSCDVLVLGGKPSSLPVIRDILIKYMPVRPSGIICLKGYPIGDWYPFARRCGGIADPKTTCVVGAAVWLFAEKLKRLESLSIRSENEMVKQRECFIGTFIKDTMTMNSVLFPAPSGNVTRINMSRSQMLGVRRIDSNLCMVNPLWEIVLDRTKLKGNGPFTLTLSQNGTNKEVIEVKEIFDENNRKDDKNAVSLNLRTMVSDQYWLDTGCFEL